MRILAIGALALAFMAILFLSSARRTNDLIKRSQEPQATSSDGSVVGTVSVVTDGDSITIVNATGAHKLRLAGIDAPEMAQPFGPEAKAYLHSLAPRGTEVSARITEIDKYGRGIAFLKAGELDLNLAMVTNGLAWSHIAFDRDHRFRKPQRAAKAAKLGLWADSDPMPPWNWKREHPRK